MTAAAIRVQQGGDRRVGRHETARSLQSPATRPAFARIRAPLPDDRFQSLLGRAAWASLPPAVRQRFGRKAVATRTICYVGEIEQCAMTRTGWMLAHACRLIGAPLPLDRGGDVACTVSVTEDADHRGQYWTRQYGRPHGFPQVIHSSKRFAGPTGIEEYLGLGFGIALALDVRGEALHFLSDHYFWRAGPVRLRLPRWLTPGRLDIAHHDLGQGWFRFALTLDHPIFGRMVEQVCRFSEYDQR